MDTIFKDLKVVELASVLAGPAVGLFFAELGATVIKIENSTTGGDVTRSWKATGEDKSKTDSAYFHAINWNKKYLAKDLNDPTDKKATLELITNADIVISNFRDRSAKKLGMDYKSILKINPTVIFGLITAYGEEDERPGFDALLQAETGWMHMNGSKDGPPTKMPVALIDILAAHQLKAGILTALLQKFKTGKGSKVTISLYDTAISALANQGSNYLNLGVVPQRKGSLHPNIAPYGETIKTQDGQLLLLAIGNDKQFNSLCDILACPILKSDERYLGNANRVAHRVELGEQLCKAAKHFTAHTILEAAHKASVPIGPINDLQTVFKDKKNQALILTSTDDQGEISKRVKTMVFKIEKSD